jgi:hypothetical protein
VIAHNLDVERAGQLESVTSEEGGAQ